MRREKNRGQRVNDYRYKETHRKNNPPAGIAPTYEAISFLFKPDDYKHIAVKEMLPDFQQEVKKFVQLLIERRSILWRKKSSF